MTTNQTPSRWQRQDRFRVMEYLDPATKELQRVKIFDVDEHKDTLRVYPYPYGTPNDTYSLGINRANEKPGKLEQTGEWHFVQT